MAARTITLPQYLGQVLGLHGSCFKPVEGMEYCQLKPLLSRFFVTAAGVYCAVTSWQYGYKLWCRLQETKHVHPTTKFPSDRADIAGASKESVPFVCQFVKTSN